ncbi:Nrap protein [Thelephora ganbajun]|uniref:Nrap protein n=1 Tax=Thelephora ganbajun TaxID=370292 RepID=A0ACB6ZSJ0_THEGA|nr:Nrap protein [Thelephora ganbajun]
MLQIDSLVPSVRPKFDRSVLEHFLRTLYETISSIPAVAPQHPLSASRTLLRADVATPYATPLPTEETNWKVAFQPPANITVVGSWANKLSVKPKDGERYTVDLAVQMPNELFQEKDYLNGRFFHKRAYYLSVIAAHIKKHLLVDLFYDSTNSDPRLPSLIIESKDGSKLDFSGAKARIRILATLAQDSPISLKHVDSNHCNIRVPSSPNDAPTHRYNDALLQSTTAVPHLLSTHETKKTVDSFSDALALLRIWANQRGYCRGKGGWSILGFEDRGPFWLGLLELMIKGDASMRGSKSRVKPVGRGLSSYQLFKATIGFLARHDFVKEPVYLKDADLGNASISGPKDLAVFVTASSRSNLLSGVPLSSLEMLRHDAQSTLEILSRDISYDDPFSAVFLEDMRHASERFDVVIGVDLSSSHAKKRTEIHELDAGSSGEFILSSMASILRHGLGNRAKAVPLLRRSSTARELSHPHPFTPSIIQIGFILDPTNAFLLVDRGLSVEEAEKDTEFRDFWGNDKTELRRFKDGRILECVVWEAKTVDEKAHIPVLIAKHLLRHHFGIEEASVFTWQPSFDALIRLPKAIGEVYSRLGSSVSKGFRDAISAFDSLVKQIKQLEDLPLSVATISPVHSALRHVSVFTPVAISSSASSALPPWARYIPAMDIIIEFEKSPRWPDDLVAILKMKLAFFEHVARSLTKAVKGLTARVVVDNPSPSASFQDCGRLEILTPEGWAFSASIWHGREATLLDRLVEGEPNRPFAPKPSPREKQAAVKAKETYVRQFIAAPSHHRAISNLCYRYPGFSGTVRLAKRWFASHWLLDVHISQEAVELICAKMFVGDGTGLSEDFDNSKNQVGAPVTKERGFAVVVHFLASWEWQTGLNVPLYGKAEVPTSQGSAGSPGAWVIRTSEDPSGKMWTSNGPDAVVARRIAAFAKATWNRLQGDPYSFKDISVLNAHPITEYDFIIHLETATLPRSYENASVRIQGVETGQQIKSSKSERRPGFDPARLFLDDLRTIYEDTAIFFYDCFGGDKIGGVWLPGLRVPKPFKVRERYSSAPVHRVSNKKERKKTPDVVLNESAIVAEIERMGHGLIKSITVHQK